MAKTKLSTNKKATLDTSVMELASKLGLNQEGVELALKEDRSKMETAIKKAAEHMKVK